MWCLVYGDSSSRRSRLYRYSTSDQWIEALKQRYPDAHIERWDDTTWHVWESRAAFEAIDPILGEENDDESIAEIWWLGREERETAHQEP